MARVLLQCARISKDFCEYLIIKEINVIKLIFQLLCSKDQNIYTTGCELVSQLIKYCRERKKEKIL